MNEDNSIQKIIEEYIRKTSFNIGSIDISFDKDANITWFSIKTDEPHHFLGKDGEHLNAINHIANKIVENYNIKSNLKTENNIQYIIDINNFEKRRVDNLKNIAHMMAERARFFKSSVEIEPMSSYERKIVHSYLSSKGDIKTESKGEGRERHVVITFVPSSLNNLQI